MKDLLKQLNDIQKQAVETTEGPVLVLAGAGSGKTRVLTYRIAKLVNDGIKPSNILAVTFTNKAANEIKQRLAKICGEEIHTIWAGTFHSICVRMLRERGEEIGISKKFTIYDDYAQKQVVKQAVENLKLDPKKYNDNKIINKISDAKEKMITPSNYDNIFSDSQSYYIGKIYGEYERICRENNGLDFDDLIIYGVRLLKESAKAREHYQKKFKYVHVDEFQDINLSQYELIKLLSQPQNNIFAVGDDDQSIYGWRGADVSIILQFHTDFLGTQVFKLEQNYRSTKNILGAAFDVVKKNSNRNDKTIWTNNEDGETIQLIEADSGVAEARLVAESIKEKVLSGNYTYSDIAILYRTNNLSQLFEKEFTSVNIIPYDIYGGYKFYDRAEVKVIIAYLTAIYNINDDINLKRIINVPARSIGEATVEKLEDYAYDKDISLYDTLCEVDNIESVKPKARNSIKNFVKLMEHFRKEAEIFPVNQLIKTVIDYSGYKQVLLDNNEEEKVKNIEELISVAGDFIRNSEDQSLDNFLQNISLQSDTDNMSSENGKVLLMTIHAAKGLEFPVVYVVGLEEGVFPHERSISSSLELEEERRLMYVAMTRAKKELILSYASMRQKQGNYERKNPSQFLKDIPKNYFMDTEKSVEVDETFEDIKRKTLSKKVVKQTYSPGNKLYHSVYGKCIVLNCSGEGENEIVTVIFDDKKYGVKKFKVSMGKFTKI